MRAVRKLPLHIRIAHDRSGDQLREQRDIGAEGDKVPLRRTCAAKHIDHIGHALERVKRNADWQCDGKIRQKRKRRQPLQRENGRRRIFEKAEQQHIDGNAEHEHGFAPILVRVKVPEQPPGKVVEQDRRGHQQQIDRLAPGVKHQARRKQHRVFCAVGHSEINEQRRREEEKQKR